MRRPGWFALGRLGLFVLGWAAACPAQVAPKKPVYDKRASRAIRFLELPGKRAEAVGELFALGDKACRDLARALATDPRPEIVQVVAHVLRDLGPRAKAALPQIEAIAKSDKDDFRTRAAKWVLSTVRPQGILVVSCGNGKGSIMELDKDGKQTFKIDGLQNCFDAERLPNGNYIAACYTLKLIREVDRKGKVIKEHKLGKRPMDVDPLANGNTLVATIDGETLEIDPKGKKVWSFKTKSSYEADRLPNGNTLISEYGGHRVIEVDKKGKIVWSYKCSSPMDADRLPDGNTLIVQYTKGVLLVSPKGKLLKTFKVTPSYDIRRLPDGAMLVTGNDGLRKYDAKGKLLWTRKIGVVGSIEVY